MVAFVRSGVSWSEAGSVATIVAKTLSQWLCNGVQACFFYIENFFKNIFEKP